MKKIIITIIILILLIGGYFLFFNKFEKVENNQIFDDANIVIRDMTNVPEEYYSGDSKYSTGECRQDVDCSMQGCNLEICTSDENIVSTCEINGDTPDKIKYDCGCIKDVCGWYEK